MSRPAQRAPRRPRARGISLPASTRPARTLNEARAEWPEGQDYSEIVSTFAQQLRRTVRERLPGLVGHPAGGRRGSSGALTMPTTTTHTRPHLTLVRPARGEEEIKREFPEGTKPVDTYRALRRQISRTIEEQLPALSWQDQAALGDELWEIACIALSRAVDEAYRRAYPRSGV